MKTLLLFITILFISCSKGNFSLADKRALNNEDSTTDNSADISYLTLSSNDIYAVKSATNIDISPSFDGENVSFSVSPALPSGLTLNEQTGKIAGQVSTDINDQSYTITATSEGASKSVSFTLNVAFGYVVDTTSDGSDDNTGGDPNCYSTAAGGCSLRAALEQADAVAGDQLIVVPAGTYSLSGSGIGGVSGSDFTLVGAGAEETIIQQSPVNQNWRFMRFMTFSDVTFKDVQFINFGTDATDGPVIMADSDSTVNIDRVHFKDNQGFHGGVFYLATGADLVAENSTFTNNTLGYQGGILHLQDSSSTAIFRNITATQNEGYWGSFAHATNETLVTIENSTFYGNISTGQGLFASPGGSYIIKNSTIVNNTNTTTTNTAVFYMHDDPLPLAYTYRLANNLVAYNTQSDGDVHQCYHNSSNGVIDSLGGNIIYNDTGNCSADWLGSDLLTSNPKIVSGGLKDNGGHTKTISLESDSPAIDGGENTNCLSTDQRGESRIAGSQCDIGALEIQ